MGQVQVKKMENFKIHVSAAQGVLFLLKTKGCDLKNEMGNVQFWEDERGLPMVSLSVTEAFTDLPPADRVQYLLAVSAISRAAAEQIAEENETDADEIIEALENMHIFAGKSHLNG